MRMDIPMTSWNLGLGTTTIDRLMMGSQMEMSWPDRLEWKKPDRMEWMLEQKRPGR